MSTKAVAWAFEQPIERSSTKFVLVCVCDWVWPDGLMFYSISRICERTSLNRKTVISALASLEEMGYIVDTGHRRGDTKQVKVYSIPAAIETAPTVPKTGQSQKRNSSTFSNNSSTFSDNSPVFSANSPKNGTRIRIDTCTKRNDTFASSDESLSAGAGDVVELIPLNTGQEWPVLKAFVEELERAYPAVDVPATLKEIRMWCIANKRKRKTKTGVEDFVSKWCAREQNKG